MSLLVGRKAICRYLGGVDWRTVRRWADKEGFPLGRGNGQRPTLMTEHLDEWQRSRIKKVKKP